MPLGLDWHTVRKNCWAIRRNSVPNRIFIGSVGNGGCRSYGGEAAMLAISRATGKGTEAVTLFFKLGLGGKGDGLRVGNQSGNVGASGGGCGFRPNTHNTGACWGPQRGGFGLAGRNLASGCSVVTTRMNTELLAVGSWLVAGGFRSPGDLHPAARHP